jgi:hypothetical protein
MSFLKWMDKPRFCGWHALGVGIFAIMVGAGVFR